MTRRRFLGLAAAFAATLALTPSSALAGGKPEFTIDTAYERNNGDYVILVQGDPKGYPNNYTLYTGKKGAMEEWKLAENPFVLRNGDMSAKFTNIKSGQTVEFASNSDSGINLAGKFGDESIKPMDPYSKELHKLGIEGLRR